MKPIFNFMVQGYSGKCDGLVYYYNRKLRKTIVRKHVIPKATESQARLKAISQNLSTLNVSEAYKQDLKHYAIRYESAKIKGKVGLYSWNNVFLKIMWAMAKHMNLDLTTITREQIENDNLPCRTVKQAVEAGFIPPVPYYEWLTNTL